MIVERIYRYVEENPHLKEEPPCRGEIPEIIDFIFKETGRVVVKSHVSETLAEIRLGRIPSDRQEEKARRQEERREARAKFKEERDRLRDERMKIAEENKLKREEKMRQAIQSASLRYVDSKESSYVYILHAVGSDRYKIGYSKNPFNRAEEINGSQSPFPCIVIACVLVENAAFTEEVMHIKYQEFRVHGEWFRLSNELARSAIFELVSTGYKKGVS